MTLVHLVFQCYVLLVWFCWVCFSFFCLVWFYLGLVFSFLELSLFWFGKFGFLCFFQ